MMTETTEQFTGERWLQLRLQLKERFGKKPNMEAILFLIGINEYRGNIPESNFSKEQKQDLMHVATCTVLAQGGYYRHEGYDEEGWPLFSEQQPVKATGLKAQEELLREYVLQYFGL